MASRLASLGVGGAVGASCSCIASWRSWTRFCSGMVSGDLKDSSRYSAAVIPDNDSGTSGWSVMYESIFC